MIGEMVAVVVLGSPVLEGTVWLDDPVPPKSAVDMSSDPVCQRLGARAPRPDEHRLADAFVWLDAPPRRSNEPLEPQTVVIQGCRFVPHVLGLQTGQRLRIHNLDPTLHHVSAPGFFDWVLPKGALPRSIVLNEPRIMVELRDGAHPWMAAYVGVLQHSHFAVTNAEGAFVIDLNGLEPGVRRIRFWHEVMGPRSRSIEVPPGGESPEAIRWTFSLQDPTEAQP
ncbi:MAG: hypothetical protein ACFB9M_05630 [Myxococcota bacterium]